MPSKTKKPAPKAKTPAPKKAPKAVQKSAAKPAPKPMLKPAAKPAPVMIKAGTLLLPRIIGHRGAKAVTPENTLTAIRRSNDDGGTWVEFDVKLTKDNVPILMHDAMLDRTTSGKGPVAEHTLAQIKDLDAGTWFGKSFAGERVPTLVEALTLMDELGMGFNLEIKPCPGREAETAKIALETVLKHWTKKKAPVPVISSFKLASLAMAQKVAPDLPRGFLTEKLLPDWRRSADSVGCRAIHPGTRELTQDQVREVKAAGYPLLVWTVNDGGRARELVSWGVDSLITDAPAAITTALGGAGANA
jgi:glycerophosphoryl diester phosphodiesterase